jgi:hypothetical protein
VSAVETAFAAIAKSLLLEAGVSEGTGFGSNPGLRVNGKIFAMLVRCELVVKLPAPRCAELVARGSARAFDRGQGRPLREWICVGDDTQAEWTGLAREALAFVAMKG